ncbi:MAG: hypothetical protein ACREVL_11265 [Solimonas sp.]
MRRADPSHPRRLRRRLFAGLGFRAANRDVPPFVPAVSGRVRMPMVRSDGIGVRRTSADAAKASVDPKYAGQIVSGQA